MVPDADSQASIAAFVKQLGFDAGEGAPTFSHREEIHCTIIYSPSATPRQLVKNRNYVHATAYKADLLGHPGEKQFLVLRLIRTPELNNLFAKWRSLGCQPTFDDYLPHISITTDFGQFDPEVLVQQVSEALMKSPLHIRFGGEQIEDIT